MTRLKGGDNLARRKTLFGQSLLRNNIAYNEYVDRLTELAISMFKWENLPESVSERYMELSLFLTGKVVYFNDEVLGNLALRCACNGRFDVYGIPKYRRAYAVNGYQRNLDDTDSVIIYNNMIHTNSVTMVRMFAERLYNLDRIIEVNANAQKTPVLVQASEQQRLTMLNLYQKYDGNEPFIFGDKNLDWNSLKAINTEAPYVADKIYQLKNQTWNEALTYLGISNINTQKKERLITDEAIRSQGGTIASRYSRLESRRQAVEQINKMFGTDIQVSYREDFRQTDDEYMIENESEDQLLTTMVEDLRTRTKVGADA